MVGASIAAEEAKREAALALRQTEEQARREQAKEALKSLDFIIEKMFNAIEQVAPVAKRSSSTKEIKLGSGILRVQITFPFLIKEVFQNSGKDIVCGALIKLEQDAPYYLGRSANFWFGELTTGEYRWWEIPYFMLGGIRGRLKPLEPFGISQTSELSDVDFAMARAVRTMNQAATPIPIDGEYMDCFIERWQLRLAQAAEKKLQRPNYLPEQ